MTWAHGPVVTRRRLGRELKRLRDAAGLKLEDVARRLDCSTSKVSRLETGKGIPRWRDVRDMLDVYSVPDGHLRERLLDWAQTGRAKMWWQDYADVLQAGYDTYVELEWDAAAIRAFEPVVIHGLLQTADYARAVLQGAWGSTRSPRDIERMVEVRRKRRDALEQAHGLDFHCILDESMLYRVVGSLDVLRAQIEHLVELSRAEHIDVRVLPFSAGIVASGRSPFAVLEFADGIEHGLVHLERADGVRIVSEPTEIDPYRQRWAALDRVALTEEESIPLMEEAARRLASE